MVRNPAEIVQYVIDVCRSQSRGPAHSLCGALILQNQGYRYTGLKETPAHELQELKRGAFA
jgi:hypothetical protein